MTLGQRNGPALQGNACLPKQNPHKLASRVRNTEYCFHDASKHVSTRPITKDPTQAIATSSGGAEVHKAEHPAGGSVSTRQYEILPLSCTADSWRVRQTQTASHKIFDNTAPARSPGSTGQPRRALCRLGNQHSGKGWFYKWEDFAGSKQLVRAPRQGRTIQPVGPGPRLKTSSPQPVVAFTMCLLVPQKPKKAAKARNPPKPASMPSMPRYSRMHTRQCCAPAPSALHPADDLADYLQQQYPDDRNAWIQYTTQLGLHRLDDSVHAHADKSHQATEAVGKGVKDIQDRLVKMEESLDVTGQTAGTIWAFCENEKDRRSEETEARRKEKEEATRKEMERLKGLVEKMEKTTNAAREGFGEAEVLKLLGERETRLELQRLRRLENGAKEEKADKADGLVSEAQLEKLLDQREQAKELQRLQAQQAAGPKEWLARPDLIKILDQRDRERDFARLQRLETDKPKRGIQQTKQEEAESQERTFRKIPDDHEQRRELERLKTFEAEARRHKAKDSESTTHQSLSKVEQLIVDILEKHDRKQDRERSRESVRSARGRQGPPWAAGQDLQRPVDEILSLLLHRRSVAHAADVLESLLHQPASTAPARGCARGSDRPWILAEVLRALDNYEAPPQSHGDGPCRHDSCCAATQPPPVHRRHHAAPAPVHAHAPPPPPYPSAWPSGPDAAADTRRWSAERRHVRFDSTAAPMTSAPTTH